MIIEYDLIVIGASPEGIHAALTATSFNARVALVEQPYVESPHLGNRILGNFAHLDHPEEVKHRRSLILSTKAFGYSPAILADRGVDVISEKGEFCPQPNLTFITKHRRLRARAYLIATGSVPKIPHGLGLEEVGYLTPLSLWDNLSYLPQNLVVLGSNPSALELGQSLALSGRNVTLLVHHNRILPQEDPEVSLFIQRSLEADGINIITAAPLTQVKEIEGKKWVQVGNRAIESEEIVLAGVRRANVEGLNLEGVGVKDGILINEKLQTTNPMIYACGDVVGGYALSHLAMFEAEIAVKNALFWPFFKVDYNSIPWAIFTVPQVARVGMTAAQAICYYGEEVEVVREYFKDIPYAQVLGETTGFCQFVIRDSGVILGAYIVGAEAAELIGAIALAMKHKIKLDQLGAFPYLTLSQIIPQTSKVWQGYRRKRHRFWQNCWENLFIWRRNWTK
ncbi:MAG: NAD(P)/FAD-dependent oxidoreductase [Prochloron sp. SP5CPC1]|nr:NAD(P)/FAD-dependent oxidoreductase [Candidatus Paraprochloron terpiosi SP5CPC1]